ncbi:RES family NAD+ phosphorylase [Janthinobacterium sp. PC23-8]|uniref:RES family NAD+ phosphorylase n=1 Tax=Janthinobacterium sp. PC23-8 TaxID=2012679 RepID=UPI000B967FB5|nr:RES family NAD+ phosphorylase [Janthinobacterium sp. PC23-8]OYO29048.1 hypothetical protein CD932_18170 [Janthinobacterium sp. PC23-8]
MPDPVKTLLHLTMYKLPAGTFLHRMHQHVYGGTQFNPGTKGNARFSPIATSDGTPIPTMYAGATFDCAAMESIFHDVPFAPGYKSLAKSKLKDQVHSKIRTTAELMLADLRNTALRKLGIERRQLIDTEKDRYPSTREVAVAIHTQRPDAQGLLWTSRQDDSAKAVVLFGNRIMPGTLQLAALSRDLLTDAATYDAVLSLAERIGVDIVPGT